MDTTMCIFCQIVRGEAPAHRIWEDDQYLAFLSIFPNTEGFSVVIPMHYKTPGLSVDLDPIAKFAKEFAVKDTAGIEKYKKP